ncbi:MAG: damage repair protein [Tenericutes bacterium]|nr:damage repair protein [Mycoplasmatota bacterium]
MKERNIVCIDLKSFFASVECVYRNLDPFNTPLVVADVTRGKGAMTLAITPYLKHLGIESRSRVFSLPKNIKIIYAKPRMSLYEKYSKEVINVYKSFISKEDIHIYSIDEVFIDVTDYLKYYKKTDYELALDIMKEVKNKTGLTSSCGIGPNIFLAKVAMDTEAKHSKEFIAKWTYEDIENKLWKINKLSEIWGIGKNTEAKLNNLGIKNLKDINKYSKDFYIKRFGPVAGNDIWCKGNGIDYNTIKDMNKNSKEKSMSMSQVLNEDYNIEETLLIITEMNDMLCKKLRKTNMVTKFVFIEVTYSRDLYKSFSDTIALNCEEDNTTKILDVLKYMYYKNVEDLPIRKVTIAFSKLSTNHSKQLSLFDKNEIETTHYYEAIDNINSKFGNISILRASSLLESSTIKNREKFKNII